MCTSQEGAWYLGGRGGAPRPTLERRGAPSRSSAVAEAANLAASDVLLIDSGSWQQQTYAAQQELLL